MKKRYAIVRVDNTWCPNKFENVDNRFVCDSRKKNIKYVHCERCLYGDTKEQLIRKVAQALIIDEMERYRKTPNCDVNKTIFDHESKICLEKAKFIVEFLGVE